MRTDRHPGGYDPKVGGYRGASLPPGVKPVPPKGASADIPTPIPDAWVQQNHYAKMMFDRLWSVADLARKIIANDISPFDRMEARIELRKALARLDGENM